MGWGCDLSSGRHCSVMNSSLSCLVSQALKATRVPSLLFDHCETEMKEIMLDAREAPDALSQFSVLAVSICRDGTKW